MPAEIPTGKKRPDENFPENSVLENPGRSKKLPGNFPDSHATVTPAASGLPSRLISVSPEPVTRKNLQVPCFDRSQSSAETAASRAMIRSCPISSLKSSVISLTAHKIRAANITRMNAMGSLEMIEMS